MILEVTDVNGQRGFVEVKETPGRWGPDGSEKQNVLKLLWGGASVPYVFQIDTK